MLMSFRPRDRLILPDPTSFEGISIDDPVPQRGDEWLPVKSDSYRIYWPTDEDVEGLLAARATLRSLSQTCRVLRELALARLWSIVHVQSAQELGRVHESLKITPSIASHVRSFCFLWDFYFCENRQEHDSVFKHEWTTKSPEQVADCMAETVAEFSSLRTFGWHSGIATMSASTLAVLAKMQTIRHFAITLRPDCVHACQYAALHISKYRQSKLV